MFVQILKSPSQYAPCNLFFELSHIVLKPFSKISKQLLSIVVLHYPLRTTIVDPAPPTPATDHLATPGQYSSKGNLTRRALGIHYHYGSHSAFYALRHLFYLAVAKSQLRAGMAGFSSAAVLFIDE